MWSIKREKIRADFTDIPFQASKISIITISLFYYFTIFFLKRPVPYSSANPDAQNTGPQSDQKSLAHQITRYKTKQGGRPSPERAYLPTYLPSRSLTYPPQKKPHHGRRLIVPRVQQEEEVDSVGLDLALPHPHPGSQTPDPAPAALAARATQAQPRVRGPAREFARERISRDRGRAERFYRWRWRRRRWWWCWC